MAYPWAEFHVLYSRPLLVIHLHFAFPLKLKDLELFPYSDRISFLTFLKLHNIPLFKCAVTYFLICSWWIFGLFAITFKTVWWDTFTAKILGGALSLREILLEDYPWIREERRFLYLFLAPLFAVSEWVKSLSRVRLFATPWTVTYQAPPSMEFSRQEYWSGSPFPAPGDLPDPGIEPGSPALRADAVPSEPPS